MERQVLLVLCLVAAAATRPATRPALEEVELTTGIYLLRSETRITVTSDGDLRAVYTTGKSYGP